MADAPNIIVTGPDKDTLRTSAPKLNHAIDNANEALNKSILAETNASNAVTTSNQAKSTAESVQEQFNQVVIDGDSSVEAAQARVDAGGNSFTTLKDRLDSSDEQLADIAISIMKFDQLKVAIGTTGIYDYAPVIQAAIDHVASLGGGTVLIPKGTFYVVGKAKTIYLSSNVNIKGSGKNVSIIKIHESTGDWGQLLRSRTEAMHDIEISDLTLDCNIDNLVGFPDRWGDNNRVLLYLGEGLRFNIHDVKLISNGVWAIRGKISYSTIRNVEVEYDVSTYTGEKFDVSCFWLGGEENFVTNNSMKVTNNSTFIPPTGIECQGHRSHYSGNTIIGFSVGFIFTSCTSYENIYHVIEELGSNNTKIYNNIITCRDGGVIIWPMNVPEGSIIKNLTISDNTIDIIKGGSATRSVGIGMRLGNPFSATNSDKDMTAPLHDCKIFNNIIKFDTRRVNTSPSAGDHAFRFECDVEIDGLDIQGNTVVKAGGMGVWLSENEMRDPSTNEVINNEWIKNVNIIGNTFKEVKLGVRVARNVSNVIIENNVFEQKSLYSTFADNMVIAIQSENSVYINNMNYKIKNNHFLGDSKWRPFYPRFHQSSAILAFYPPSRGMDLELTGIEVVEEKPSGLGTFINNSMHVRMLDGTKKKTTFGIGGTVGALKTSSGSSVQVTAGIDTEKLTVNDSTNLYPHMHLILDNTKFNTDIVIILAVIGNDVYFAQNVGLKSGATLPSTTNYFSSLVTA